MSARARRVAATLLAVAVAAWPVTPAVALTGADIDAASARGELVCPGDTSPQKVVLSGSAGNRATARAYRWTGDGHATYGHAVPARLFRATTPTGDIDRPGPPDARLTKCQLTGPSLSGSVFILFPRGLPQQIDVQGKTRL